MTQMYAVTFTAMGEVHDAQGNLISSEPVETTITVTREQARDLGLDVDEGSRPPAT